MDYKMTIEKGLLEDAIKVAKEMIEAEEEIRVVPLGGKQMFVTTNNDSINAIATFYLEGRYIYFGFNK